MKLRYGTSSVQASSSRVAKAEHAASWTLLLGSRIRFSSWTDTDRLNINDYWVSNCQAPSYYWRWGGLFEGDLPGPVSDCCTRQQCTCVPVCVCLARVAGRSFNTWTTKVMLPGQLGSVCLCMFITLCRYAGPVSGQGDQRQGLHTCTVL